MGVMVRPGSCGGWVMDTGEGWSHVALLIYRNDSAAAWGK